MMRLSLLLVLLFALMTIFSGYVSSSTAVMPPSVAPGSTQQSVAGIESYCKEIERYAKRNPQALLYFVNSLPGEEARAATDKRRWYPVKSEQEMSDAERSYATESLAVLMRSGEIVYAQIGEPMEHSRHDDGYYFRGDGTLAKISSDYWSNIESISLTRQSFYSSNGKLLRSTAQCFEIITTSKGGRTKSVSCGRAEMRGEINDYKFPIYRKNSELPGYALLKKS